MITRMDRDIGRLADLLRSRGIERNTVVMFISDNGPHQEGGGDPGFFKSSGPLRGIKRDLYEGGIRVPAAICWPAKIPRNTVSPASAAHIDVFATVLDAAGIPLPKQNGPHAVSGMSLLAHLQGGGREPLADRYLYWDLYGKMAALHGDWKIVANVDNHHGKWDQAIEQVAAAKFELYDLANDIGEKQNLADERQEIYRDLKEHYLAWFRAATRE
mgnify:CR=1 FL=1